VVFESIVDAVACAIAIQRNMATRNATLSEIQRIIFRIGVNLGDIALVDGDVYGHGVNVAARLEQLCAPGGVTLSGTAVDHIRGKLDLGLDYLGEHRVKNIDRPVPAYRVRLDGVPARRTRRYRALTQKAVALAAVTFIIFVLGIGAWRFCPPSKLLPGGPRSPCSRSTTWEVTSRPAGLPMGSPRTSSPTSPASGTWR